MADQDIRFSSATPDVAGVARTIAPAKPAPGLWSKLRGLLRLGRDEGDVMPPALAENSAMRVADLEAHGAQAFPPAARLELSEAAGAKTPPASPTAAEALESAETAAKPTRRGPVPLTPKAAAQKAAARSPRAVSPSLLGIERAALEEVNAQRRLEGLAPSAAYYIDDEHTGIVRDHHKELMGRVEQAEREAARAAKAAQPPKAVGPVRKALRRLSVRIEGLGDLPIDPPVHAPRPPAALVIDPPPALDLGALRAAPPKPLFTARFMPQPMKAPPRYAPLKAWMPSSAPGAASPTIFTELPESLRGSMAFDRGRLHDVVRDGRDVLHDIEASVEHLGHDAADMAKAGSRSKWIGGAVIGSAVAALAFVGLRSQREKTQRDTAPETLAR